MDEMADDDDADDMFDARTELRPFGEAVRAGQMLLEALSEMNTGLAAWQSIKSMSAKDLRGIAMVATVHLARARGMTDEAFLAWSLADAEG